MKDYSVLAELDTILYEDGLDGVVRHVLANAEYWRGVLGMDPPEPPIGHLTVGGQDYWFQWPLRPSGHTTEHRPAYDPARSTLEQRLDLASLSRAEGQE